MKKHSWIKSESTCPLSIGTRSWKEARGGIKHRVYQFSLSHAKKRTASVDCVEEDKNQSKSKYSEHVADVECTFAHCLNDDDSFRPVCNAYVCMHSKSGVFVKLLLLAYAHKICGTQLQASSPGRRTMPRERRNCYSQLDVSGQFSFGS